ncbi:glycosyltransferase [Rubritalea spongiae]|uniref:Glycosyltransferase n=1 Tax=Rubritalea spongiae TaxID=430797 RepID=A0ABW5E3U7_9BACT
MQQRNHIPIVGNSDEKFFPGLSVAFLSLLNAASGKYDYTFYVLNGGLSEQSLQKLESQLQELSAKKGITVTLNSIQVDERKLQSLPQRRGSRMPYAKLILPDLLPTEPYAVYVDADILYNRGVEELYNKSKSASNWLLSGVRDYHSVIGNECPWIHQLTSDEKQLPYINSGFMMMNLKDFRKNGLLDEAITLRAAAGEQRLGDQSVFNFVCRGKILLNHESLNHLVALGSGLHIFENGLESNIHFIGKNKPWFSQPNISQYTAHKLWHSFADEYNITRPVSALSPPDPQLLKKHQRKCWTNLFNPKRAQHYKNDLASIKKLNSATQ